MLTSQLQVMMMSRITLDLKKRASEHIHYGFSTDPMVVDEGRPYRYPPQLSRMRFRDPVESGRRESSGDFDIDMAPRVSSSREVAVDETFRQTKSSGGHD